MEPAPSSIPNAERPGDLGWVELGDDRRAVTGFLWVNGVARLCGARDRDIPPECGGERIELSGLDVWSIPDVDFYQGVVWSTGLMTVDVELEPDSGAWLVVSCDSCTGPGPLESTRSDVRADWLPVAESVTSDGAMPMEAIEGFLAVDLDQHCVWLINPYPDGGRSQVVFPAGTWLDPSDGSLHLTGGKVMPPGEFVSGLGGRSHEQQWGQTWYLDDLELASECSDEQPAERSVAVFNGGGLQIVSRPGPELLTEDLVMLIVEIFETSWGTDTEGTIWFGVNEPFTPAQLRRIASATPVPVEFFTDRSQLPGGTNGVLENAWAVGVSVGGWIRPNVVQVNVSTSIALDNGGAHTFLFEWLGNGEWERVEAEEIGVTTTSAVF